MSKCVPKALILFTSMSFQSKINKSVVCFRYLNIDDGKVLLLGDNIVVDHILYVCIIYGMVYFLIRNIFI